MERYVLIPDLLIDAFAHDALAVGVYVAIARLAVIAKSAVPLAAWDLVAWMGSNREADRAAIMRRIVKLEQEGWVIVERAASAKHRLLPTWGRDQQGNTRPWRFDEAGRGQPQHVRGRRVPLALFDDYIGRLDLRPGHGRALIRRYFTRPLLDLVDIGTYTVGLHVEVRPTPRLRHLGLHSDAGIFAPGDSRSLLERAASGKLTTLDGDTMAPVRLSVQGYGALGLSQLSAADNSPSDTEQTFGSNPGSRGGSEGGSIERAQHMRSFTDQEAHFAACGTSTARIAWDVGMSHESTKDDSAPNHALGDGEVSGSLASCLGRTAHVQKPMLMLEDDHLLAHTDPAHCVPALSANVIAGHRELNVGRAIRPGEWYELRDLQETYGREQLLIWQARACHATVERPYGITPAYYRACAARLAFATTSHLDTRAPWASVPSDRPAHGLAEQTPLDPACDALLQAIGVRERHKLAGVPRGLIEAWRIALAHPGLTTQFTSPIGFAVRQMQRGNAPPPVTELDGWAERARRADDRYETWRQLEPIPPVPESLSYEQQLEARVRALAPPDADVTEMCELAAAIEAGATDTEALALLLAKRRGEAA